MNTIKAGQVIDNRDHISRLPTELLHQIFHGAILKKRRKDLVGSKKGKPEYVKSIDNLALVCKRWENIMNGSPTLRSFVSVYASPSYNKKALSSGAPLTIVCNIMVETDEDDEDLTIEDSIIAKFAKSLSRHVHHWDTALLSLEHREIGVFRQSLESADCSVRDLTLKIGQYDIDEVRRFNLLGGKRGQLKRLELEGVRVVWDSCALSGLEHLSITGIQDLDIAPSVLVLLGIFRGCPQLQTLKLDEVNVSYLDAEANTEVAIVNLPYINTIDVNEVPVEAIEYLFRLLRLNVDCGYSGLTLDYGCFYEIERPFDFTSFDSHIPLIHRSLENCLKAGRFPEIAVTNESICLNARTRGSANAPGFEMKISESNRIPPENDLVWWNQLIASCNMECPIRVFLNARDQLEHTDYLERISNLDIAELVLNDASSSKRGQYDLFRILTTPVTLEGSDHQVWLLHKTRTLKLQISRLDQDAFLAMLRKRHSTIEGISVLPAAGLAAVDLGKCEPSQQMLEELRSMFGGSAQIRWQFQKPPK